MASDALQPVDMPSQIRNMASPVQYPRLQLPSPWQAMVTTDSGVQGCPPAKVQPQSRESSEGAPASQAFKALSGEVQSPQSMGQVSHVSSPQHVPFPHAQRPQSSPQLSQLSPGSHSPFPQQLPQSSGQKPHVSPTSGSQLPSPQQAPQSSSQVEQVSLKAASQLPLPQH